MAGNIVTGKLAWCQDKEGSRGRWLGLGLKELTKQRQVLIVVRKLQQKERT